MMTAQIVNAEIIVMISATIIVLYYSGTKHCVVVIKVFL